MSHASHDLITATLGTIRTEFLDAAHLGIRYAAGAPPAGDDAGVTPSADEYRKQHIAVVGSRALRVYAERVQAVTDAAVRAGLYVLAVVPAAGCPGRRGNVRAVGDHSADADVDEGGTLVDVGAFAVTTLGVDPSLRLDVTPELLQVLPPGWQAALDALMALLYQLSRTGAERRLPPQQAGTAAVRLALLALSRGLVVPDPTLLWIDLRRLAQEAGWHPRVVRDWRRALLGAERVITDAITTSRTSGGSTPALDAQLAALAGLHAWLLAIRGTHDADGPRGLRATLERLGRAVPPRVSRAADATPDTDALRLGLGAAEQDQLLLLRTFAPHFVPLVLAPRAGTGKAGNVTEIRAGTTSNLLSTLDRLLAQCVRSFPERALAELHPADLLTERVSAASLRVPVPDQDGQAWIERGVRHAIEAPTVPLLRFLFDGQLGASRAHSPQVRRVTARASLPFRVTPLGFTQSLVKEARTFAHAFRRAVYWQTSDKTPARIEMENVGAIADEVAAGMEATLGASPDRPQVKDARRVLQLVSWPQLVCVGLPRLRAHVHALRRALQRRPRFGEPAVDAATYDHMLELYAVLSVFAIDPLRIKTWRFARLGHEIQLTLDPDSETLTILRIHTHVTGEGDDNYTLSASKNSQGRELDWPASAVDRVLFGEYLERVRAQRATRYAGRLYGDPAREVFGESVGLPLFLAPSRRHTPTVDTTVLPATAVATAVAMSEDMLRERFAEALHWVIRQALGRDLPPWPQFKPVRGDTFYAGFTPHILRALVATYLLKVRARGRIGDALDDAARAAVLARRSCLQWPATLDEPTKAVAIRLLGDHEKTLHRRYVAWSRDLASRLRDPIDGWTHPAAYDAFMDRLLCGTDEIDWSAEPDLPLPPTCTHDDLRVW